MTMATSSATGPVVDPVLALSQCQAALAALRASQCYKQYKGNGTLPSTKIGECERDLLAAITSLGA